ncbi:hypothetical protein T07_3703 [Trichinella nelsoni]|uniref:Uncharacterized protein n=1 Tax=Trichinella nelsoni TaxID=6336 RepID=A0A0V0SBH8_9BILA|nr:hypothetical protein T07_3703 [Trichinella nelsoni]
MGHRTLCIKIDTLGLKGSCNLPGKMRSAVTVFQLSLKKLTLTQIIFCDTLIHIPNRFLISQKQN